MKTKRVIEYVKDRTFPMPTSKKEFKNRMIEMGDYSDSFEDLIFGYGVSQLTKKYFKKLKEDKQNAD